MHSTFVEQPILNSPYGYLGRHWELDNGLPTDPIAEQRRHSAYIVPVPPPRRESIQTALPLGIAGLSDERQQYDPTPIINEIRRRVDAWRQLPNPQNWSVTPETARLLQHWRSYDFPNLRPFFCQVEPAEAVIWLTEVAGLLQPTTNPRRGFETITNHLKAANESANPELFRLALKLATGAGKTTVMAMLIAWQTVNAVRYPRRDRFTKRFLIVTPGIVIRDRLRSLFPWTVCDFSLMDAIEAGIVKIPRVPIDDNVPTEDRPVLRKIWKHVGGVMPRTGRRRANTIQDPHALPSQLFSALEATYNGYEKTHRDWREAGIGTPPSSSSSARTPPFQGSCTSTSRGSKGKAKTTLEDRRSTVGSNCSETTTTTETACRCRARCSTTAKTWVVQEHCPTASTLLTRRLSSNSNGDAHISEFSRGKVPQSFLRSSLDATEAPSQP